MRNASGRCDGGQIAVKSRRTTGGRFHRVLRVSHTLRVRPVCARFPRFGHRAKQAEWLHLCWFSAEFAVTMVCALLASARILSRPRTIDAGSLRGEISRLRPRVSASIVLASSCVTHTHAHISLREKYSPTRAFIIRCAADRSIGKSIGHRPCDDEIQRVK